MSELGKFPGLVLRRRTFYFRLRVPEHLHALVKVFPERWHALVLNRGSSEPVAQFKTQGGSLRTEVWKSLLTSDQALARKRYHEASTKFLHDVDGIAQLLESPPAIAQNTEIIRIAQRHFNSSDERSDFELTALLLTDEADEARSNIRADLAILGPVVDPLAASGYRSTASLLLKENGFDGYHSGSLDALSGYLVRADRVERQRSLQRVEGEFRDLHSDGIFPPAFSEVLSPSGTLKLADDETLSQPTETIDQAYSRYVGEKTNKGRSPKTLSGYSFVGLVITGLWAGRSLSSLKGADANELISVLQTLPASWTKRAETRHLSVRAAAEYGKLPGKELLAPVTANGYLGDVSAFFSWCVREDLLTRNFVAGKSVKPPLEGEEERDPFDLQDLRKIFGLSYRASARFRAGSASPLAPTDLNLDARFWAPLIALFTGMRLNEICQLICSDIRPVDGVLCICIDTKVPDEHLSGLNGLKRRLKTKSSKRNIPVPEILLSLGFCELVAAQSVRLFPDLPAAADGRVSEAVSRWFARYLDGLGIVSKDKVFHSFRHTWRNANTNSKLMRDVTLYIGGWKAGEVSDIYNRKGPSMSLAKEQLDLIKYDGLSLDHLRNPA